MPSQIKIVIPSGDWRRGSPMDLQEPLDEALAAEELGEIVRGGAAPGHFFLVAEVSDPERARACLRRRLAELGAPSSVELRDT